MINFLLGILVCIVIALILVIIYLIKKPTAEEVKLTQKELEEAEKEKSHWSDMMNYSQEKAYSGGK